MGRTLDTYRRYRELLERGAFDRVTDVLSEDWVETCVGLTGWTSGLDVALENSGPFLAEQGKHQPNR